MDLTRACVKNQIPVYCTEGEDDNNEDKISLKLQGHNITLRQEKNQNNLEVILKRVVSDFTTFLTTFQETTTLLKNIDRYATIILKKL